MIRTPLRSLPFISLFLALLTAVPCVLAQDSPSRCMRDAEGELYCAQWEAGVAVRDGEGDIVCAPGECVHADAVNPDWSCSSVEGGSASVTPDGAECEGGCQPPDSNSCQLVDNIDDNS